MTTGEILEAVSDFEGIDTVSVENGSVRFIRYFETYEEQESHDVAWDIYCSLQESLNEIGLRIDDLYTDHDSVCGEIVPV